jgi:hypothetical protein
MAGVGRDAAGLTQNQPRAGIWGFDRATAPAQLTHRTILLMETGRNIGFWTAGGPATVRGLDPADRPLLGPGGQFAGLHPGGGNTAFDDGSVTFTATTISADVLTAMTVIGDSVQ